MDILLETFKKYNVRYNRETKKLYINEPIPVKEFVKLRKSLQNVEDEVLEIRLETKGKVYRRGKRC